MINSQLTSGRQDSRLYYMALIFSVLYLVRFVTLWEPYRDFAEFFRLLAWIFCSLTFFSSVHQYKHSHQLLIICIVLMSLLIGMNCNRLDFMYFSSTLIIGAKNIVFEDIIKVYFILGLSFCLFNVVGNQMGIIKDATFLDQSEDRMEIIDDSFLRESFGYDWCTDFASHVFLIVMSYWIYKKGVLFCLFLTNSIFFVFSISVFSVFFSMFNKL